jgi:hypothetical protein
VSQEVNPEHRWISVKERLPDENEIVIINGGVGCLIGGKWRSQLGIDSGRPVEWTVTHWTPLPTVVLEESETVVGKTLPGSRKP